MPVQCRNTLKEISYLYLDGNIKYNLPRHNIPIFLDPRGRAFTTKGAKYWIGYQNPLTLLCWLILIKLIDYYQ